MNHINTALAGLALSLALTACTTLSPEQQAALQQQALRQIICSKGNDCDEKWGRAVAWIARNSQWKIQMQNDYLIQTYTAVGGSPASSFLVNKVPLGDGRFHITMTSGCDNIFGCIPDAVTLRARFHEFVGGPEATPQ